MATTPGSWRETWRTMQAVTAELIAAGTVALCLPLRPLFACDQLEMDADGTPVLLVHGLFGDPSNFIPLRRTLVARGVRSFVSESYLPRVDYLHLAAQLGAKIEALSRSSPTGRVDVVGHSLGGLAARCLLQRGCSAVNRLVTLGAPYVPGRLPPNELAVFAADDLVIPPPRCPADVRGSTIVVSNCGHIGLLQHPVVHHAVAGFLLAARSAPVRQLRAA